MKRRRVIPQFALYGEPQGSRSGELPLHIEEIQTRSQKYRWEIGPHQHKDLAQCVFIIAGPASVSLEAAERSVVGPALVLVPPHTVHAFRFSDRTQGFVLTLLYAAWHRLATGESERAFRQLFAVPRMVSLEADREFPSRLQALFAMLLHEFQQPESARAPVCVYLAQALVWLIERDVRARTQVQRLVLLQHHSFERFQSLLEAHYREHWPVPRYAASLRLSPAKLTSLCLEFSGRTTFQLIQERLILEVERRLIYTTLSVNEIAAELGFRDPAYFCRFFRRHRKVSPRRFRHGSTY